MWKEQGGRSGRGAGREEWERSREEREWRKWGREGGESEERDRAALSRGCVCTAKHRLRTNTHSLVTSQLETSERVTHTLEGAWRIDTATSRVTAIDTHSTFINV